MALVLTRKSGESIVFKDKKSGQSITATLMRITNDKQAWVRFAVGPHAEERYLKRNEEVTFFDGNFFLDIKDGNTIARFVCEFPVNINIARKELLK